MGSGSQTTGILARVSDSAVPPPRARCVSAAVLEEQSPMLGPWWTPPCPDWFHSAHGPARRQHRSRHSRPRAPRKILSQLVSGARWAGSGLPAEHPYGERLSAPAQTMDGTRLRLRSVSFAHGKVHYRQVALTRCPLQAAVSAPPTSPSQDAPDATRRDKPAQEGWVAPLIPCQHSPFPGRHSFAEASLLLAPLLVRGSLRRSCPGRGPAARCPGCGEPDCDSGRETGRSRKTCCYDPRGMRPLPGAPEERAQKQHVGEPVGSRNLCGSPLLVSVDAILAEERAGHFAAPCFLRAIKCTRRNSSPFPSHRDRRVKGKAFYSF